MFTFLLVLAFGSLLLYICVQNRYKYWKNRGIYQIEPAFLLGGVRFDRHFVYRIREQYIKAKGQPVYGNYNFLAPMLHVIDLNLVKQILVKDFQYFTSRGALYNAHDDPISEHLFAMDGNQKWKNLRAKLSPTFTTGKMKYMFPTLVAVGEQFFNVLCHKLETDSEVEMKDLLARFTTDIIGNVAFGLDCNTLVNANAKFREIGMKTFDEPRHSIVVQGLLMMRPSLVKLLGIKIIPDEVSDYFTEVVRNTVSYRVANNIKRNDFMDLLVNMYNAKKSNSEEDADMEGLSMNEIAAQAFVFFLAGFETSSTAMSFTLYELAQNDELQTKARQNVQEVLAKHNYQFTYESIKDMNYLGQCIDEGMRKYPPLPILTRVVDQPYCIPGTNCTLEKGQMIVIPVYSLHHDPEYFPNPDEFNPEHFSSENIRLRNSFCYLPFGEGPRNCIGMRFGIMQAKLGLAILLNSFKFRLSSKTSTPIKFKRSSFILTSESGLHFIVEKL